MDKRLHPSFPPKKGDFGIAKNYRGIMLTSIAAKIYNPLLLNHIKPENEKILSKNQNVFQRNQSTTSDSNNPLSLRSLRQNLEAKLLFIDFSQPFDSTHREKKGANTSCLSSPQRNC